MSCRLGSVPAASCRWWQAASDITKPGVQKPHCEPWQATIARWAGCVPRRSSTVTRALPSSVGRNWMQLLTGR